MGLAACIFIVLLAIAHTASANLSTVEVVVDFGARQDPPLFKKYGVMNSGLVDATRYNDTIFDSLAAIKADSMIVDLYMGTTNPAAGFRWTVGGFWNSIVEQKGAIHSVVFNFDALDHLARGLNRAGVWPYWAYSYAPDPFQPALTAQQVEAGITVARCPGFDNDTAHYLCVPPPHEWANCWKCPPKDPDGMGYHAYSNVSATFSQHWKDIGIPVYEEIWNEPDLTEYYDAVTTVTMFLGSSKDYTDVYLAAAHGMLAGDPDAIVGGPGVAYNINSDRRLFPHAQRPNGGDMMVGAAGAGLPVDFFSFHDVNPCMDAAGCNISEVFETRTQWSRYALTQPEVTDPAQGGKYNTTEIHCTEFFPAIRWVEEMLPFTASPALGVMMLNHFVWLLGESDVTKVHWAQYMEVDVASNGTALLDYQGNARPAWHSFRFWGDLPIERAAAHTSNKALQVLAGFDDRTCRGSVLVWNNVSTATEAAISVANVPFSSVSVVEWRLDDFHPLGDGLELEPALETTAITVKNGTLLYPPSGTSTMPPNGTMYLNITALGCTPRRNAGNPLPEAIVLRKHYFFGFRPARTYLYSEFDSRSWSAHLGMGNETYGYSIAGANIRAGLTQTYNISMRLMDGTVEKGGIWGMRVDYWDEASGSFPPESSYFFYDSALRLGKAAPQIPRLWGSKADVSEDNFLPRTLDDFSFDPLSNNYRVPRHWGGKLCLLFVLKDGSPGTKVRSYVTGPDNVLRLPDAEGVLRPVRTLVPGG